MPRVVDPDTGYPDRFCGDLSWCEWLHDHGVVTVDGFLTPWWFSFVSTLHVIFGLGAWFLIAWFIWRLNERN